MTFNSIFLQSDSGVASEDETDISSSGDKVVDCFWKLEFDTDDTRLQHLYSSQSKSYEICTTLCLYPIA